MNNEEGRRLEKVASTSLRSVLAQEPRTFSRRLIPSVSKRLSIRAMETSWEICCHSVTAFAITRLRRRRSREMLRHVSTGIPAP